MVHPIIGTFIFRVLDFSYPVLESGQVLCVRFILPCKDFVALVLCKMAHWLSVKVVALYLDKNHY